MTNSINTPPAAPETRASRGQSEVDVAEAGAAGVATTVAMKRKKRKITALVIALVILALLFGWYLMNRKPLSLPGLSEAKLPHYERSLYGATKPLGVAATAAGDRIYVTESDGTKLVRVYDDKGKQTGTLKPPTSTGPTHFPIYVAINPKTQDVYVSDRSAASIYVYDAKGTYLRTFAPKGNLGGKWAPMAMAFGKDGSLYVTDVRGLDAKAHRVLHFGPDGTLVRSMGAPGQLTYPNGIAIDSHGNIEVSDSNKGRLLVFNVAGKVIATISQGVGEGDLGMPRGAAVDDAGRLFVVDTADHMVRAYTVGKSGAVPAYIGSFGGEGQLDGTFEYPNGVATDTRAHIYVTDRENNRVQVWGY
jgi:DNA-binding beta-propeller fold protein YncE